MSWIMVFEDSILTNFYRHPPRKMRRNHDTLYVKCLHDLYYRLQDEVHDKEELATRRRNWSRKGEKLKLSNQKKMKFRKIIHQSEEQSKARQMEAAHDAYQIKEHFKVAAYAAYIKFRYKTWHVFVYYKLVEKRFT